MLDIAGFGGNAVPNTFITRGNARHLAVVLPGFGYTCMMPAMFFAWKRLLELGADVLLVEYDYTGPELARVSREEMAARLTADVSASASAGLAAGSYERVTLLGKSLGTLAMAHLLGDGPMLASADCIWLTPILRDARLCDRVASVRPRSIFVIGSGDAEYDPSLLDRLRDVTGGEVLLLEGANHSLEVPGDVMASIGYLAETVRRIGVFAGAVRRERVDDIEK